MTTVNSSGYVLLDQPVYSLSDVAVIVKTLCGISVRDFERLVLLFFLSCM